MTTFVDLDGADPAASTPGPQEAGPAPLLIRAGERLASPGEDLHTARAELTLGLDDALPLRTLGFDPDPLTPFARAYAQLRPDLGETAEICLDLLPVTPAQRRARVHRAVRAEGAGGPPGRAGQLLHLADTAIGETISLTDQLLAETFRGPRPGGGPAGAGGPGARQPGPLETAQVRARTRAVSTKLLSTDPLWQMQLLLRTRSAIPGRAEAHLHAEIIADLDDKNEAIFTALSTPTTVAARPPAGSRPRGRGRSVTTTVPVDLSGPPAAANEPSEGKSTSSTVVDLVGDKDTRRHGRGL